MAVFASSSPSYNCMFRCAHLLLSGLHGSPGAACCWSQSAPPSTCWPINSFSWKVLSSSLYSDIPPAIFKRQLPFKTLNLNKNASFNLPFIFSNIKSAFKTVIIIRMIHIPVSSDRTSGLHLGHAVLLRHLYWNGFQFNLLLSSEMAAFAHVVWL